MPSGPHELHHNRRRTFRAGVHGCAVIHAPDGGASRGQIADLGLGGVRIVEQVRDEPGLDPGTDVVVEIECAGAGWVAQRGRVLRHDAGQLAIGFETLAPEVEDLIEDEVLGAVEAEREPRVVVIDRSDERRARVAADLRRHGCCSLEVATPLEAVSEIERSRNHVCGVAISQDLTQTQADDFVKYLDETHPEVEVVRIVDDGAEAVRELAEAVTKK